MLYLYSVEQINKHKMKNSIVIIGKGAKLNTAGQVIEAPTLLKVFKSKWEREVGDRLRFEGDEYIVLSTEFENENDAEVVLDGMVKLYIQKGWWRGVTSVSSKF